MKTYSLKVNSPYDDIKTNYINIDSDTYIDERIDNGAMHNSYIVKNGAKLIINTIIDARNNINNSQSQIIDIYHKVELASNGAEVSIKVKGVTDKNNKIIYRSNILTDNNYQNLEGEEMLRFVSLSGTAEIDAIPSLEIANNNINAAHSLKIEKLNIKRLFYLIVHGIDIDAARSIYVAGLLK